MSYRTILAHLQDAGSASRVLAPATVLARNFGAHLTGLHVVPAVQFFYAAAAVQVATEVYDAQQESFDQDAREIETIFRREAPDDVNPEWRSFRASGPVAAAEAVGQAMCADLIVTGQADPEGPMPDGGAGVERLVMETGRPVLVIPYAGKSKTLGKNVVVAWNGRREAARAVFDALPLLKEADKVTLLWINPSAKEGGEGTGIPGAEMAEVLARHNVDVEVSQSVATGIDVGDDLLSRAADLGADLIVMGAYGHSRLREYVFGGATRHILEHMTVPVLFAH